MADLLMMLVKVNVSDREADVLGTVSFHIHHLVGFQDGAARNLELSISGILGMFGMFGMFGIFGMFGVLSVNIIKGTKCI